MNQRGRLEILEYQPFLTTAISLTAGIFYMSEEVQVIAKDYLSERSALQIQLLIFLEAGLSDRQPMRSIWPAGII